MSTESLNYLRCQISTLSESERAQLAHEIIMSLDGPCEDSAGKVWQDEIERRISALRDGSAKLLTREQFRQAMWSKLESIQGFYGYQKSV